MLKTLQVLSSMVTLKEFTVQSLHKHSGVNAATIRTLLLRKEHILSKLGVEESGSAGGRLIRYRLKPEAEESLREEIGGVFEQVKSLPEVSLTIDAKIKAPLALLSAENILFKRFPEAETLEEKRELLELAKQDIRSGGFELKALAGGTQDQAREAQALMKSVEVMKTVSEAELAQLSGQAADFTTFVGLLESIPGAFLALSSSGQSARVTALSNRIDKTLKSVPFSSYQMSQKWAAWRDFRPRKRASAAGVSAHISVPLVNNRHTIAVLPLIGNQPTETYMYDGITRGIWHRVCELPDLTVVSPSRVRGCLDQFRSPKDLQALGKQLDVQTLLLGNVDVNGNQLKCHASLVSVENGTAIWHRSYDTEFADVFSIEADISESVSKELDLQLTEEEQSQLKDRPTENSEAYRLYMEGRYYWQQWTASGIRKAIDYFEQALKKDRRYALAYAGLADCYNMSAYETGMTPGESFPKAKADAYEALELDDRLAEAYTALAYSRLRYYWNWEEAEARYLQAINLNPNYTLARLWYSEYLAAVGQFDNALEQLSEARRLDPASLIIGVTTGTIYYFAGDYDHAIEEFKKTLDTDKTFVRAHFRLGSAYLAKGMYAEAIRALRMAAELSENNPREESSLGYAFAVSGDHDSAKKVLEGLETLSKQQYVSSYSVMLIYLGLGQVDNAFQWLLKAFEEKDPWLVFLKVDPRLAAIRSDDRFHNLLKDVRFPA